MNVSWKFSGRWSFKGVSTEFLGCFKEALKVFQECFKGVSRKIKGWFKGVSRQFQRGFESFKENLIVFQECFNEVLFDMTCHVCMDLIAATRAEGGLVFLDSEMSELLA